MKTLLEEVKAAGAGQGIQLVSPLSEHGIEVIAAGPGTYTTLVVALEGSISGNLWQSLGAATCTASHFTNGGILETFDGGMVERVRANITDYASGSKATAAIAADAATGVTPASGESVSIDGTTYTFQTASLATDGFVIIGATYATALANLLSAINYTGAPGVDYVGTEAHNSVSATASTAGQILLEALEYGTDGNSIALTGSGATLAVSGATMSGGTDQGLVTVNYTPYPTL